MQQFIQRFKKNGIKNVRTYSTECNQLPNILQALESAGDMKMLVGLWMDGSSKDDEEISNAVSALSKANKNLINGVMVGNEAVQGGLMQAGELASKIKEVKGKLSGFKVGTVETPTSFDSQLLDASDMVVVNIHPFFASVSVDQGVSNLQQQLSSFKGKAGNKEVVVGETGWPSEGDSNGAAQPSTQNLQTYVKDILQTDIQYYYFETQDSDWKNGGDFNVEQHWGLLDAQGKSKIPQFQ